MALREEIQARTAQPQTRARVKQENPLTRGLVFAAIPVGRGFFDVVSGQMSADTATSSRWRPSVDGNKSGALSIIGSATIIDFANPTGADAVAGVHSIFLEGSLETNATTAAVFESAESGAGNGFRLNLDDAGFATNSFYYWANNGNRTNAGTDVLGANSEQFTHRLLLVNDGTNSLFYSKGKLAATSANTVLPNASGSRRTRLLGTYFGGGTASAAACFVWNRVLSSQEYLELYQNPWAIFDADPIWVPVSAGGSDLTLSLTGQAATAFAGTLAPSAANALSGQAATASTGTITYSAGSDITIALSGQAVATTAGAVGLTNTIGLAGQAVTASAGTLSAGQSLSGQAVTSFAGTTAPNVTVSLTGQAVTVSAGTLTALGGAAVTVSGGAYEDKPKKKRYITKVGDKLIITTSANKAIQALESQETPAEEAAETPAEQKAEDSEQVEVPIRTIKAQARAFQKDRAVVEMIKRAEYEAALQLYEQLKRQQDEEDIEMLLLAL